MEKKFGEANPPDSEAIRNAPEAQPVKDASDVSIDDVTEMDKLYPRPKTAAAMVKERLSDPELQELDVVDSAVLPNIMGWEHTDNSGIEQAEKLEDTAQELRDME